MEKTNCFWSHVVNETTKDYFSRTDYQAGGVLVMLVGLWVGGSIMFSRLKELHRYLVIGNYAVAVTLHHGVYGLIFLTPLLEIYYEWRNEKFDQCQFLAFWENFFAVFETESLLLVCIERYVSAKYAYHRWGIPNVYQYIYIFFAIFFSLIYTGAPFYGVGRFAKDFNCVDCTYDMVLPADWTKYFVLFIFFLRAVKAPVFMFVFLILTRNLELKMDNTSYWLQEQITHGAIWMVRIYIFMSLPLFLVRLSVILDQLLCGSVQDHYAASYILIAMFLYWFAPLFCLLALPLCDPVLRLYMFNICQGCKLEARRRSIESVQVPSNPVRVVSDPKRSDTALGSKDSSRLQDRSDLDGKSSGAKKWVDSQNDKTL